MDVVRAKIEEERLIAVFFEEAYGMLRYAVGNVLIFPQCLTASLHISDASDAIYNRMVVTVVWAGFQIIEQFGIVAPGRFARKILLVAHLYRCVGVIIRYKTVLDKHAGNSVGSGSHDIVIVEADVLKTARQGGIPVLFARFFAQPKVPLPDGSRAIASTMEEVGKRILPRVDNHLGISSSNVRISTPPGILAREQ